MDNTYALVDDAGHVLNVVVWDGDPAKWSPPDGKQVVVAAAVVMPTEFVVSPIEPTTTLINPANCPAKECPLRNEHEIQKGAG
jgi:hypothetical protein